MWFDFDTTGQHTFWTKMAHTWDEKGVSGVSVSYGGISVSFNNNDSESWTAVSDGETYVN